MSEIFDRLDLDNDGYIHKAEVEQYLQCTPAVPADAAAFKFLLSKLGRRTGQQSTRLHGGSLIVYE